MILRVLTLGFTGFLLSACVNDGELFESDAGVEGESLLGGVPAGVDPDDIPVVIAEGETTGVSDLDPGSDSAGSGDMTTGGNTGGDAGNETGTDTGGTTTTGGDGGSDTDGAVPSDAEIDASNGLFLLPADCTIVTGDDGRKYCFSRLGGDSIFVTTANDRLLWSYNFPQDSGFTFDQMLADDTLFVINRATDNSGTWNFIGFSRVGRPLYDTQVLAGSQDLIDVQLTPSGIYTITDRGEGNGFQVTRIDRDSGMEAADLRFPMSVVESLEFDESSDGQRMILRVDGRRQYYDPLTFERIVIIYALDPSTYQQNVPEIMASLRADYIDDFQQVYRATNTFLDSGVVPLEADGSIYSCAVSGTLEVLPENNTVSELTFTRAYQYSDCVMSSVTVNGKVVYSALGVDGVNGTSGTEILTFDAMQLTLDEAVADAPATTETPSTSATIGDAESDEAESATRTLTSSSSNVWSEREGTVSSQMDIAVTAFSDTSAGLVTSISNASYSRMLMASTTDQASEFVLSETGQSNVTAPYTGNTATSLQIDPAFSYGNAASVLTQETLSSAPVAGMLIAEAGDGSVLTIDAAGSAEGTVVYTVTTEEGENRFEDSWLAAPLDGQSRL